MAATLHFYKLSSYFQMPYKSCTSNKLKNKGKRFTNHSLTSFSHFDDLFAVYSTINGEIILHSQKTGKSEIIANIKKTSQLLIPNYKVENDYVTVMDTYNQDCFVGTSWGIVYLLANVQFKYKIKPQLITLMSSSIHNLEILGTGMKTLLYTANVMGKLAIYNIREVRSTFDVARRPSIAVGAQNIEQQQSRPTLAPSQLVNMKNLAMAVANEIDNEGTSRLKEFSIEDEDEEHSDVHQLLENEIEPAYYLRYKGETPQYICHARQILAYLTIYDNINGKVRFFNLFSEQLIFEHVFEGSYPITCQIYARDAQGRSHTFAQIGMSDGRIYEICLHSKTVVEVPLQKRVGGQIDLYKTKTVIEQNEVPNKPVIPSVEDTSATLESLASENRFVGDILGVITEQNDNDYEKENTSVGKEEQIETIPFILTDKIYSVFCKKDLMLLATGDCLLSFKRRLGGRNNGVYYVLNSQYQTRIGDRPNYTRIFNSEDKIIATAVYGDGKVMHAVYSMEESIWDISYLE